ncbi:hypothetical protein [Aliiroseovarius crassostreae]|uniref:hypothetical protein n=1 Tax=Aliiroseovarius crassostreae TaxID=154981 RepID=UPI00223A9E2B|nr:hypothetical protein [Aliiroseovarius crassostreae]
MGNSILSQDPDSFAEFTRTTNPAFAHLFKSSLDGKPAPALKSQAYDEIELVICAQLGIEPGTLVGR